MPGQDDTREFDRIVARLQADDPQFASRVDGEPPEPPAPLQPPAPPEPPAPLQPPAPPALSSPRQRVYAVLAGLSALFAVAVGGWTGLIIAIAITVWAVRLILADRPDRG